MGQGFGEVWVPLFSKAMGPGVGGSVKDYIDHVDHHLAFLLEKRARLEKLRPQPPRPAPHAQRKGEVP